MPRHDEAEEPAGRHHSARYYRIPKRASRWVTVVVWSAWIGLGVAAGALWAGYEFVEETISTISPDTARIREARRVVDRVEPGKPVNILLIGSDSRGSEAGNSDSIILVHMDSQLGFISMLSFARDLWVNIPGIGQAKINAAYAAGERAGTGGPGKVIETIKELTGQQVNGFVEIDFAGFAEMVDDLGGVYIDVDRRYFNDNSGPDKYEMIDLKPGYQKLNGADALDYVRYRHTDDDFARIVRQQTFLSELKRRTRGQLSQGPRFVRLLADHAQTDINDAGRLLNLIRRAIETPDDRVSRVQVKGISTTVNEVSLNELDPAELRDAIQDWLNPEFLTGQDSGPKVVPAKTRVTVLNGSGRSLVGEQMAELLRGKGYLAASGGNADSFGYTTSAILFDQTSQTGLAAARALRTLVGPTAALTAVPKARLGGAQAAVVVGGDFGGSLHTPPPPERPAPPDVVSTARLVPIFRNIAGRTGMKLMVPLKVARGSEVRQIRVYRIDAPGGRKPWTAKIVFHRLDGGDRYWGITATQMNDPPILEGATGPWRKGTGLVRTTLFYNGRHLAREAWEYQGVRYWITNVLDKDHALTAETMHEIARSFRPARTARLRTGEAEAGLSVEYDAATP
ncbi:MAG: LCP family protein [Thermoleophilia bacterium]|nr:LCP family protein [Thermoleophilia bacterium]